MQSPQTNVVEALLFSAKLRINGDIDKDTLEAYVDEVMDLVELTAIRGAIVSNTLNLHASNTQHLLKTFGIDNIDISLGSCLPEIQTLANVFVTSISCHCSAHIATAAGGSARSQRTVCGAEEAPHHCSGAGRESQHHFHGRTHLWPGCSSGSYCHAGCA